MLNSSPRKHICRRLFNAALLVGATLLVTVAIWAYAQERHDLPPFDYEKAKQLSVTKRAEYERELFNEVMYWDLSSPKYMERDGSGANRREADWLAMARDGYELAYITLRVLQPSSGTRYSVAGPLARLTELADRGDIGAMCLYSHLIDRDPKGNEAKYIQPAYSYKRQGAKLGHPACLRDVSYFLMTGIHGFQKDVSAGFDGAVQAERAGYDGAGAIAVYLAEQPSESDVAWTRYYCWESLASQHSVYADPGIVLRRLMADTSRPGNQALSGKLEGWQPTLDECVAFGIAGR